MTNNGQRYWGRAGYVELEGVPRTFGNEAGQNTLDFKFDVTKYGSFYSQFSVGILGLNSNTINELTVWRPQDAISEARQIKVFAGYTGNDKPSLIAKGGVWHAIPNSPPEMWLNMSCMSWLSKKVPVENPHKAIGYPQDIFKEIGGIMGLPVLWNAGDGGFKRSTFMIDGTVDTLADRFALKYNVIVYENNGVLLAISKNGEREKVEDAKDISIENGLISVGNLSVAGATIRIRLRTDFDLFSWVNLKSKLIPKANGPYYVTKVRHVGHMRGEEWYTELTMLRKV